MTEELISNELIETTYNYFFKRLNNSEDAKDLAQDILLEAIKALKRKKEIKHFYSWYWKLAHNRYCMFLSMKENKAVCIDTYIDTLKDEKPNSIDDFIKMDEISEINYAISKLSKIHRQIIVYFYLKEMKISEIASDLNLPEGTVKRRLYDAKKSIRKEVVNMQSYGKGSYVPTKINIWGCYELPKYWNRISEIMAEQILFTCSDKGKSISQIAN
ncbi:MAG TPA: sigma-70 family RNA polymerase sigma factor, partial [Lachnospiraceae bacterium]|nr:sigma-70 family RNA polymerase sigma factor [Lachnospiraceae bacterium]